ncbi:Geraniol 8-hydroxylase [Linum perenne]
MEFKEAIREITEDGGKVNLGDYFPVLGKVDLQGIQKRTRTNYGKLFDLFGTIINKRLKTRESENYVSNNDMLDTLLDLREEINNETSMDLNLIKHLFLVSLIELFVTTSSTLEWAMAELLRNPDTLIKAREELDQTIGKGNHLQESDITRLPYLQAILKKTFKLHPTSPLLLPRKARSNVEICGFTMPRGAQILINVWAISRDPTTWNNPNSFMPERFMGSKTDVRGHNFELIPFGGGRRICPGLSLAMRMPHTMLGSLIHWFDWKLEDGVDPKSLHMEEKFGITLQKTKPLFVIPTTKLG